jgi:hypothetical protein
LRGRFGISVRTASFDGVILPVLSLVGGFSRSRNTPSIEMRNDVGEASHTDFGRRRCDFHNGGFLAGIEVEAHRKAGSALSDPTPSPTDDPAVRPIADLTTSGRVVGGFEHQAAMILGVNELVKYHPQTLAQIAAAIHVRIKIIGVIANEDQNAKTVALLRANNLPEDCIDFFQWPVEAMWVRDYAPYFLVGDHTTVIDHTYPERNRDFEDSFSIAFAATFGPHYTHARLKLEGGNLTSNGDGLCITTTKTGLGNEARGYDSKSRPHWRRPSGQ